MKKIAFLLLFFLLLVLFFLPKSLPHSRDYVVTSNFALYDMSKTLLPQSIEVFTLIPFGVEAHSFEPTPKSLILLEHAKAFIYSSKGVDAWLMKLKSPKSVERFDVSSYISWMDHDTQEAHEHEHHGMIDPHYWFDIKNQKSVLKALSTYYIKHFPRYKESIEKRAKAYDKALDVLDEELETALSSCHDDTIFVTHNAFAYLERAYGIKIETILGLSSQGAPNPKVLKELITKMKQRRHKVIFFESFISNESAKLISKATGAEVKMLYTLATVSSDDKDKGFIALMRSNIKSIKEALSCQ